MLTKETDRNFVVYPSWADLPARWDELPGYFADPLGSGFLKPGFDFQSCGYPKTVQPFQLIDGPAGGGLVAWWGDPDRGRFLPLCILGGSRDYAPSGEGDQFLTGANLREPNGVRGLSPNPDPHDPGVCFLEPHENRLWKLGIGKRTRMYDTGLSYEQVDAAGDSVYWIVRYKRPRSRGRELLGLGELSEWSRAFGVKVRPLDTPPGEVAAETDPWFSNPGYQSAWFQTECDDTGLGYQFAVLVYIGNHLRHIGGASMESMHLIAQIEGRPNFRHQWSRKN